MKDIQRALCLLALIGVSSSCQPLWADQGMWLLNQPPAKLLKQDYNFEVTPDWVDHLQKASLRLSNGSGAFVSSNGLIVTNQHVVSGAVEKLSTEKTNYLKDGFYAPAAAQEMKLPGEYVEVLVSIEDVSPRVEAALALAPQTNDAVAARRAVFAEIEKESLAQTGLKSTIVTLYEGGAYHLYRYKRYTDIRLVFAPEEQAALFGGDPDNFEFPRHDFDIAFLRAYENGGPAKTPDFFKVNAKGVEPDELVFVTGNPGRTNRSLTVAEFESQRDVQIPETLAYINLNEVLFSAWGSRSGENERRVRDELLNVQNARKMQYAIYEALLSASTLSAKQKSEHALKDFARTRANSVPETDPWATIETQEAVERETYSRLYVLEAYINNSTLCKYGRLIHRAATEKQKPNGERLRGYRETALDSLEFSLLSDTPVDLEFERIKLINYLTFSAQLLRGDSSLRRLLLSGKSPTDRATELVGGTKLGDVDYRKHLYAMTPQELARVDDSILSFIRSIDAEGRAALKTAEQQAELKKQAHAQLAKLEFARNGTLAAPDATSTLRFCYGTVKGYDEGGQIVAPATTIGAMFARSAEHEGQKPFDVPKKWSDARSTLAEATPLNFVSTCDTVGGNSGSPVLNQGGEWVGIIFDQNLYSLGGNYVYTAEKARAIAVDVRAVREVLSKVYKAEGLLRELQ